MPNDIVVMFGDAFRIWARSWILDIVSQSYGQTVPHDALAVNSIQQAVEFLNHQIEQPGNF